RGDGAADREGPPAGVPAREPVRRGEAARRAPLTPPPGGPRRADDVADLPPMSTSARPEPTDPAEPVAASAPEPSRHGPRRALVVWTVVLAALGLVADQLTKGWAESSLTLGDDTIPLVASLLGLPRARGGGPGRASRSPTTRSRSWGRCSACGSSTTPGPRSRSRPG